MATAGPIKNPTDRGAELRQLTDQIPWSSVIKGAVRIVIVAVLVAVYFKYFGDRGNLKYVFVFVIGGLLGLTEILGRYTDSPIAAMKSPGAAFYVFVNAFASMVALYLLLQLAPDAVTNPISQVLLAGLGAMAFLRSSFSRSKLPLRRLRSGRPLSSIRC